MKGFFLLVVRESTHDQVDLYRGKSGEVRGAGGPGITGVRIRDDTFHWSGG